MGRTKGSLNKKTIEKMQKVAATETAPIAVSSTEKKKVNNKEEGCTMQSKKIVVPINKELLVEGFNPDDFKQYYDDGTAYLPFKVQLAWFRLRYPNGKTPVFRPEWSPEKVPGTFVATARVYKDAADPIDNYLSEASAKKGPDTKIMDTEISIDAYNDVQRAALSMALRFAGFWCSLTESDLSKELADKNVKVENSSTPEKKDENVSTTTDEKAVGNSTSQNNVKQETDAPTVETNVEQEAEAPTTEETVDAPTVETNVEQETEAPATEETVDAPTIETNVEQETEAPATEETVDTPTVETNVEQEAEAPTTEETVDTPAVETNAEQEAEAPAKETVEDVPEKDEATIQAEENELAELRAIEFENGYYKGTIGDLEQRLIAFRENNQSSDNNTDELFLWLLNSNMAKRRFPKEVAAANRIADLRHPEWRAQQ